MKSIKLLNTPQFCFQLLRSTVPSFRRIIVRRAERPGSKSSCRRLWRSCCGRRASWAGGFLMELWGRKIWGNLYKIYGRYGGFAAEFRWILRHFMDMSWDHSSMFRWVGSIGGQLTTWKLAGENGQPVDLGLHMSTPFSDWPLWGLNEAYCWVNTKNMAILLPPIWVSCSSQKKCPQMLKRDPSVTLDLFIFDG